MLAKNTPPADATVASTSVRHKPLCYPSQTVAPPGTESTHTAPSTFTVPRLSNSFCFVLLVFFLLLVFLCLGLCLFLVLLLFCCNQEFKIISCQLPGCLRNKAQDAVLTNKTMEEAQAWIPYLTWTNRFLRLCAALVFLRLSLIASQRRHCCTKWPNWIECLPQLCALRHQVLLYLLQDDLATDVSMEGVNWFGCFRDLELMNATHGKSDMFSGTHFGAPKTHPFLILS